MEESDEPAVAELKRVDTIPGTPRKIIAKVAGKTTTAHCRADLGRYGSMTRLATSRPIIPVRETVMTLPATRRAGSAHRTQRFALTSNSAHHTDKGNSMEQTTLSSMGCIVVPATRMKESRC